MEPLTFVTKKEMNLYLAQNCSNQTRDHRVCYSTKKRYKTACRDIAANATCPFVLKAKFLQETGVWSVTDQNMLHTCILVPRATAQRSRSQPFAASLMVPMIKDVVAKKPDTPIAILQTLVKRYKISFLTFFCACIYKKHEQKNIIAATFSSDSKR